LVSRVVREDDRPVSKNARARKFVDDRLRSTEDYGAYATAVAHDVFDGEPLKPFLVACAHDNTLLRMRALELRAKEFAYTIGARVEAPTSTQKKKQSA